MSLFVVDIDGTLADWREREEAAGRFPGRADSEAYEAYLNRLMSTEELAKDKPIPGMQVLLRLLASKAPEEVEIVYLTGRSEKHRQVTERWLLLHRFPQAKLIMRPNDDFSSPYNYKEREMLKLKKHYGKNIMVLDDDGEGDCSEMYANNNWTHLKVIGGT